MDKDRMYMVTGRVPGGEWTVTYAETLEGAAAEASRVQALPGVVFVDVQGPAEPWGRPYVNLTTSCFK